MKITQTFQSVSIVLPVMNETTSLTKTMDILEKENATDIHEIIIVVCNKTTKESLALCNAYVKENPERYRLHFQKQPFLGNAIREGFELATGSHVITMASDLETNPSDVKHLLAKAKAHPDSVITASRWLQPDSFKAYGWLKQFLNWGFQHSFSHLYGTKLSDLTFGFRCLPRALAQAIHWEHAKHPFILETLVKPLRLGVNVIEIPTDWQARIEGESQNSFMTMFQYVPLGIKMRFCRKETFLK